jgi:hypothetical protein
MRQVNARLQEIRIAQPDAGTACMCPVGAGATVPPAAETRSAILSKPELP